MKKKSSIFSFGRQKANSLTFCAKISSDRQIWLNRHWNRVEWTQEMVFNTYHHTRTSLDKKIETDEKNFQKHFSLPIFYGADSFFAADKIRKTAEKLLLVCGGIIKIITMHLIDINYLIDTI